MAKKVKAEVRTLESVLAALGKISVETTRGQYTAGSIIAEDLAPKFKGDTGPAAKQRYADALTVFAHQVKKLWGRDDKSVLECLDVFRFCSAFEAGKEARIDELRPLLRYSLAPIKPAEGFKTRWKMQDTDAAGFSRKKVAEVVLAEVLAGNVLGPTAVENKIKAVEAEMVKQCLDTASDAEKADYKLGKDAEAAKKARAAKTRLLNQAEELGLQVSQSTPKDIAKKLAEDVKYREAVCQALLDISPAYDAGNPLAKFGTVMATFAALAKQHVGKAGKALVTA